MISINDILEFTFSDGEKAKCLVIDIYYSMFRKQCVIVVQTPDGDKEEFREDEFDVYKMKKVK